MCLGRRRSDDFNKQHRRNKKCNVWFAMVEDKPIVRNDSIKDNYTVNDDIDGIVAITDQLAANSPRKIAVL